MFVSLIKDSHDRINRFMLQHAFDDLSAEGKREFEEIHAELTAWCKQSWLRQVFDLRTAEKLWFRLDTLFTREEILFTESNMEN